MSLFPTLHVTGELPNAHRAHLERHGITLVGADDEPDVVLVLAGTDPVQTPAGSVVVTTGDDGAATAALLASRGVVGHSTQSTGPLVLADLGGTDLLAW